MKKLIKHNVFQVIAIVHIALILFWVFGCNSKVISLNDHGLKINRVELQNELETILRSAEIRFADLDKQDRFKQIIFENAALFAGGGTVNITGLLTTLAAVFGFGAVVDNRRKDTVIKTVLRTNSNNANKT